MSNIAERYLKKTTTKNAYLLTDISDRPVVEFIDTGNIALNILLTTSPTGGFPTGKISQLAGPMAVGKSFIAFSAIRNAQKMGYTVFYYDTEGSEDTASLLQKRNLIPELFVHNIISLVKETNTDILRLIEEKQKDEKILIVVDSIGNLTTDKEYEDLLAGENKRDMTRAQELKGFFRTITVPAAVKNVPVLINNHVYGKTGTMYPENEQAGGGGPKYNSSIILELSKAKEKESDGQVIGALVTAKAVKNRLARENEKMKFVIDYRTGLSKYSGLFDLALASGIITEAGKGWYMVEGEKVRKSDMVIDTEYWDHVITQPTFLDYCKKRFAYQSSTDGLSVTDLESDEEDDIVQKPEAPKGTIV